MKIKKLETFTKPYVSFVKTTLEDGSQGFGQMSTYHADITAQIFHKQVAPWVLDKSWNDFNDIENLVLEKEHKFPGSYLLRAIAGLDTSLWDLKGKLLTTLPIIIFLVIPLVFIVTMGEIDLSFASTFGFAAWFFAGSIKYLGFDPFLGFIVGIMMKKKLLILLIQQNTDWHLVFSQQMIKKQNGLLIVFKLV